MCLLFYIKVIYFFDNVLRFIFGLVKGICICVSKSIVYVLNSYKYIVQYLKQDTPTVLFIVQKAFKSTKETSPSKLQSLFLYKLFWSISWV